MTSMAGNPWGGSEELWCKLANEAHENGDDVFISYYKWSTIPDKIADLEFKGVKSFPRKRISYNQLYQKPTGKLNELLFSKRELNRIIKKTNPDHVFLSMGGFSDLQIKLYRDFLMSLDVRFSIVVHVNPEDRYFSVETAQEISKVCAKAHKVFFVSERLLEIAKRQTGFGFSNSEIILNPVNMDNDKAIDFPVDSDCIQMACVGRLTAKTKGQALLLQVLSNPIWKSRNWKLNIYGKGPDEAYFKHLTHVWGLSDKVTFCGHVKDIRNDIWSKNHLLVMPSYYEGLPLALIESMLCARTAVVTDVGGAKEVLPESTGFISDGATVNSLGKALEEMWKSKNDLKLKGETAREDVLSYVKSFPSYKNLLSSLYD